MDVNIACEQPMPYPSQPSSTTDKSKQDPKYLVKPLCQNPPLVPLSVALMSKLSQPGQIKQATDASSSINLFFFKPP